MRTFLPAMLLAFGTANAAPSYFKVQVVDDRTGRGVPLVELKTIHKVSWWTDSNGMIAFDEPGLMTREVFFYVESPGYEYPKDGFGNRGVRLKPERGGSATIKLKRLNIAERLYRVTGAGIYRDSVLVGAKPPTEEPVLNGQVLGQDTVIATPYRGKIYWFWGDTDRASYPLGNYGASGATSELPGRGGLDPSAGINLKYFVNEEGFSRPMCPEPNSGLRWIEGLMVARDDTGRQRLVARVAQHKDLGPAVGWYLMVFNNEKEAFEPVQHWDAHESHDSAHPFQGRVDGQDYIFLYPNFRVRAKLDVLRDWNAYESFTCIAGDGKLRGSDTEIDRDAGGRIRYTWKAGADRLHAGRLRELVRAKRLQRSECWLQLVDVESGAEVAGDRGSVCWNDYRQRWIMITTGKPGEVWYSEAENPVGPWTHARRIVTHGRYNFYNPTQHPFFDQDGGRVIYFEGTYTEAFSEARSTTPRYDYNQIMYRLDLGDAQLRLPPPPKTPAFGESAMPLKPGRN